MSRRGGGTDRRYVRRTRPRQGYGRLVRPLLRACTLLHAIALMFVVVWTLQGPETRVGFHFRQAQGNRLLR